MFRLHGRWLLLCLLLLPQISLATEVKDWTLLVFLNGHNDLDAFGTSNIQQMERVGSTDKVNVVVQWASLRSPVTKRMYITHNPEGGAIRSPVVQELAPVDMGKAESLVEFVRWAKERYPARHYFIDVWNHGSGWHRIQRLAAKASDIHVNDISWDERFGSRMTTKQLGGAMTTISQLLGKKVDIYGSDACLMAMAEVAAEMKDSVDVFLGAEETEPGDGWPYDQLLSEWNKPANASAEDVASILVREYVKAYSGGQFGTEQVTLSAIRMSEWPKFQQSFRTFAEEMRGLSSGERSAVVRVAATTQSYQFSDYKDLRHFTEGLAAANLSSVQTSTITGLQDALKDLVVANGVTEEYRNSHGLSLWVPDSRYQLESHASAYRDLVFHKETNWGSVLGRLFPKDWPTPTK